MRLKNILMPLALPALLVSCSKALQQRDLDFNVTSINNAKQPTTTFNLGDTVYFNFSGNPDQVVFFSGEKGKRYQYVNRGYDSTSTIDTLRFSSALNTAGDGKPQLLISTTFPNYTQINTIDSTNMLANVSGWTDISNRATWATNGTATFSNVYLNDYAAAGKPVFLAFRYTAKAGVAQSKWTIQSLNLRHYLADTTYTIDSTTLTIPNAYPAWAMSPGWGVISVTNAKTTPQFVLNAPYTGPNGNNSYIYTSAASSATTTSFTVTGGTAAASAVATDSWVISGPINLYQALPDGGIAVKDMTTNASLFVSQAGGLLNSLANFSYKFPRRGTYNVTFVGTTNTADKSSSVARTITITVQ